MIYALLLDTADSPDYPEGEAVLLGRPLATYPLMAAKNSGRVARTYAVTGAQAVKSAAAQYGAVVLEAPAETPASAERILRHGWRLMQEDLKGEPEPELLVVLFANCPTVTAALITDGIEALHSRPELDSAVSVSPHDRWQPANARKLGADGLLQSFGAAPAKAGDCLFPDWGVQIVRPRCLAGAGAGAPPLPWLGAKVFPLKQWGGGPVDYQWQLPAAEFWLKKHGVAAGSSGLEPQPKPQPAPKSDRR